ncbi:MAG: acyl carrier protein [Gemmatimonadetes bacterium]|nr:acyl carrier protein [Gemmatimonadota bacterium]
MSENVEATLERIFRSVLKVPPAEDVSSVSVASHGWDSVAHLNLILAVEQEFRFMMTPEEASAANSFQAMLHLVNSRR